MSARAYLDWNATAPLRPEARAAMREAMEVVGNPSSVHAEGRAAVAIVARAREQIAEAFGCDPEGIVFTGSATEAAALALNGRRVLCAEIEHPCILANASPELAVSPEGAVRLPADGTGPLAVQGANSETGILQQVPAGVFLSDQVQSFGKLPVAFNFLEVEAAILSAHKIGGPKGVGALVLRAGVEVEPLVRGGGQERGRRSGTENVIGIAGFGAAAQAARLDLERGVWEEVAARRDRLEARLLDAAPTARIVGREVARLPNTTLVMVPGWKGETQVMQMDLAGFAVSAGSACSSGKVRRSRVLTAMGFDDEAAASAIRVSIGPQTTDEELERFARSWTAHYRKRQAHAA